MADQYVATDKDNVPVVPQPGDVEITDAFGNIFDNFNEYGIVTGPDKDTAKNRLVAFYKADNTLKDPQPAYQNLDYVSYLVNNQPDPVTWEPDAAQWIPRGVDNQVRQVKPYVRSPLFPDAPSTTSTLVVTLRVEENEGLIVTEDDVNGIRLSVDHTQYPSIANFDGN